MKSLQMALRGRLVTDEPEGKRASDPVYSLAGGVRVSGR
jgi:hypothetical protein